MAAVGTGQGYGFGKFEIVQNVPDWNAEQKVEDDVKSSSFSIRHGF